ncbi:hypothetical protein EDB92DRAFT_1819013 [Lactarius akahatsu]|uniref:Rho-GAP domain-containing protein n=1 Tax=Lactarius akahatsu TaxID=416441 RepID=A0AAD4LAH0_9AGAM|nr:hypothetical protein EDB92DRAFT_1819013 [Lactarius akahatsu]
MSFMSEPQSREVLEQHSHKLLAEFDTQLRIIADRYLAFFQRRRSIEATYINSLRKLHHDASQIDPSPNPRIEPTTTRAAWNKIRDNLEREVNTRQHFVNTLDADVIGPLATLKASRERLIDVGICSNVTLSKKEMGDQTRMRIRENLKNHSRAYVDHVENNISRLQQAYLKKYHYGGHYQDASNNWFGGKVSTLFRGRRGLKYAESEDTAFDDSCRAAVFHLNIIREGIAENLEYGYNCLEDLVFTTAIKDVLLGYVSGMITACAMYNDDLATNLGPEVEKALAGTDTSNLKASFRRTFSSSIPPPALYLNYRLGAHSNLVFGVLLRDCMTDGDCVPKIIRMCMKEVEERGLDTYEVIFVSVAAQDRKDNIHSIAKLLKLYLWDLPEPLCTLPLRDYIQYGQNKARYAENNFSLLRSKIRELPEVHRTTLGALCLHLARVASHSDKNAMTANALALTFGYYVFSGCTIFPGGVRDLLMEDLIQNAHTLFDEHLPPSSPPSIRPDETASVLSFNSCLSPQSAEAQVAGPSTYLRPEPVGSVRAYGRYSPSISHSTSSVDHLGGTTPTTLTPLLGSLPKTRSFRVGPGRRVFAAYVRS